MRQQIIFSFSIIVHNINGKIVSVEETKKILKNPELADEEAEKIRDEFRMLAEVIFDKWFEERKQLNKTVSAGEIAKTTNADTKC